MMKILSFLLLLFILCRADQWETFTTRNSGLISDTVHVILIDSNGIKWFGTERGLTGYNGQIWKNFTTENGLVNNRINDLAIEENELEYTLWVATDGGVSSATVSSIQDVSFGSFYTSSNSGLLSDSVRAVALDPNMVKWFGTDQGVSMLSGQTWHQATSEDYLLSNLIKDIESDQTGLVHIATRGGGVSRLKLDEIDGITTASTIVAIWSWLISDTILTIFIQNDNVKWFGCAEGAFRHVGIDSKMNWIVYQESNGLINNHVQAICQEKNGGVWFATHSGVSRLSADSITSFTREDGLASNNIFDIAVDIDDSIWFASDAGITNLSSVSTISKGKDIPYSFKLNNFPNPFNCGTVLQFQLPTPQKIEFSIYSLLGKTVSKISQRFLPAGTHRVYWEAVDENGQRLPSGVYFVVLSLSGRNIIHKVILLK